MKFICLLGIIVTVTLAAVLGMVAWYVWAVVTWGVKERDEE